MFFIPLCFMAFYDSITPHSNACCHRHMGMGLGAQYFCSNSMEMIENAANLSCDFANITRPRLPERDMVCLCCMELYGSALNQAGNITPHSNARCFRLLSIGLGWLNFCSNPIESAFANLSRPRLRERDMVCFCCMEFYGSTLIQAGNITPHSKACCFRLLGLCLGGQNFCSNTIEKIETASFLISFGVMITLISYLGLFMIRRTTEYTRTRVKQR